MPEKLAALVYDLEIVRAIPDTGQPRLDDIEYCDGWADHINMGISVLCAYDYIEDRYRVFGADNLHEFATLCMERRPLVGFNNVAFDNAVLTAAGIEVPPLRCYDILAAIWAKLRRRVKGYRLDDCAAANFHAHKSGNGALAPVLWQRGDRMQVIDYCLNDVRLTKLLFDRICTEGRIIDPVTYREMELPSPFEAARA